MSKDRTNDIEEAASDWLVRRGSEQWTGADQARFEQWLDASTLNRVAFLRLELAWEEAARLKALGAGIPGDRPPPRGRWNLTPFFSSSEASPDNRGRPLAIAALILLTVAIGFAGFRFWDGNADRYTTPVGGLASVPIADGSKITLNTNSQIRVALTETERHVDLKRGEAFFEVAKDSKRPFVVEAGDKRVVAVGTKFSVRREGKSVEVVVTEGKVRVETAGSSGSAQPGGPLFLTPGAIAHADESGVLVERNSLPEAETHLSWRTGLLMFRDQTLADAVAEFNRYNVRKIVIADSQAAALRVEGNFKATNVDAFVRLLEEGFAIRATADDDRIVLASR